MIKNEKGQALVEFVLILPIVLMIMFVLIDFARVLYEKNHLEGIISDTVLIYQNKGSIANKKTLEEDNIKYTVIREKSFVTITLEKEVDFYTPFSKMFFENFNIETERTFVYE